jgi:hypothetical protein
MTMKTTTPTPLGKIEVLQLPGQERPLYVGKYREGIPHEQLVQLRDAVRTLGQESWVVVPEGFEIEIHDAREGMQPHAGDAAALFDALGRQGAIAVLLGTWCRWDPAFKDEARLTLRFRIDHALEHFAPAYFVAEDTYTEDGPYIFFYICDKAFQKQGGPVLTVYAPDGVANTADVFNVLGTRGFKVRVDNEAR